MRINTTLLLTGQQQADKQWGYTTSYNNVTVNFPIAYSTQIFCLTAFHSAPGVSTLDVYARHVMLNGFTFIVAAPDSAYTSFERAYWLSIGVQQWGYTGEQSNKITFALSYPKAVLGIMVTTGDGIPQNPVDVTLSGATAVGYNSAGCKTYWLAYGIQQWGNSNATYRDTKVTFPIAFNVLYSVVSVPKSSGNLSGSNSNFGVKSQNNTSFIANMYDNGNGYAGFNWCAFGKAQSLPMDSHQKPAQPLPAS